MALSVIFGKPGAGKSYFAVLKISEYLEDFCRSELQTGLEHERKIYTNLPLQLDEIDDYISDRLGKAVKASKYIFLLDDDFFVEKNVSGKLAKIDWWEKIPEGALIVIDEVQHYLSSSKDEGGAYLKDFQLYISTHRHRRHDLIFLTQHTDNINKVCLNMAADAYHVINIKGRVLPFFGIPFADIDVVKQAWGFDQQYANILYGNYLGRAFKAESTLHILLKPEIYKLYKSHFSSESSDRPSLHLSKFGAVMWFLRRHLWHLLFKGVLVWLVLHLTWNVICKLPLTLSNKLQEELKIESPAPAVKRPTVAKLSENQSVPARSAPKDSTSAATSPEVKKEPTQPKVEILTPDYVIINGRRYFDGDMIEHENTKYIIKSINFERRSVDFGLFRDSAAASVGEPSGDDAPSGQSF
ncbi:MAG: hypothetical protein IJH67_03515 [Thermoguttaceae bacterium]|nr:hypothetical protein [Thermoguttaceae bacterium]